MLFVLGVPKNFSKLTRGGSRAAATSKMECFAIIVNGFQPLTIITKHSILDVAVAVNYYHKALHLGCCSSPRSVSAYSKTPVLESLLIKLQA